MIISCPSCKKSFQIDENLIPIEGRNLQCGSCGHVWFFKNEKKNLELKTEIFSNNEIENEEKNQKKVDIDKKDPPNKIISNTDKALVKYDQGPKITLTNLLGYMIVSILSFIALIILLDTFQIQLSSVFPNLELFLYNLYETLKDMFLFTKDLIK